MNIFSKKFIIILCVIILLVGILAFVVYGWIFNDNVNDNRNSPYIHIPTGASYDDVIKILETEQVLIDFQSFDRVADIMKFKERKMRSGRFELESNSSNRKIIQLLRSGPQSPLNLTFNNLHAIEDLAGAVSKYIEPDSLAMVKFMTDPSVIKKYGYTKENFMTLFIPNTYEVFWNLSPEKFVERMEKEHKTFWNTERLQKAKSLGLTKEEVYTLASIVERESQKKSERDTIAGLYINRLNQNIKLQADPTVVFAVDDFSIRRVRNKHLVFDSPYNTYKYAGLPPGPIWMPAVTTIDKTLSPAKHKLIYMCAKPGYAGEHNFAETDIEHGRNARKYHAWLNKEGIK